MLSGQHPNREVIGVLNYHPDELVSQYSVWAAYEDPDMSLASLRISPKDFDGYHPGIRKYGYRLMTETGPIARKNREYISHATHDNSREAREGLAAGLQKTYFKGVDEVVLPWFAAEETDTVRNRLLEHMAAFAERDAAYERPVTYTYERLSAGGLGRARLEAASAGTSTYKKLKQIEYRAGMSDMFSDDPPQRKRGALKPDVEASKVKILIVTALNKESAAVLATLDESARFGIAEDPAIYHVGRFISEYGESRTVLTVNAGMGKARASVLGANAIRSFPTVRYIIMVGIAGGCPDPSKPETHVRLGDVVVCRPDAGILEYDFVKKGESTEIRRYPQSVCAWMSSAMGEL